MGSLADTFKALSDETRLEMVALLLGEEELCVCDFVGALALTQSKASRHLRYLYHVGLVEDRRSGVWTHYRLSSMMSAAQRVVVGSLAAAMGEEELKVLRLRLRAWQGEKVAGARGGACAVPSLKEP